MAERGTNVRARRVDHMFDHMAETTRQSAKIADTLLDEQAGVGRAE
jgi:hypothetical protein